MKESWFHAIFINPWGLPLIIPFILLIIKGWIAFPLIILWCVYFIWVVRKSDPMYKKDLNHNKKEKEKEQ